MTDLYLIGIMPQHGDLNANLYRLIYHIFHEIVDLSVDWLPAYKNTAFAILYNSDDNPCG